MLRRVLSPRPASENGTRAVDAARILIWPVLSFVLGALLVGCGSSAAILLRPTPPNPRISCPLPAHSVRLESVVDRRGYQDAANVGFTQTGWTNVQASLRTQPTPRELVKQRVENILRGCKPAVGAPGLQLEVLVTRFQTTETTSMVSESIEAEIGVQVRIHAPSGQALGSFDVAAKAEESGLDTTDSAPTVIGSALAQVEKKLASELAARGNGLVAEARDRAVLAADGSSGAAPVGSPMSKRVAVSVRRMSAKDEDDRFGDRLRRAHLIPFQFEVRVTVAGPPISVRRDGVRLILADGSSAIAVDTRKVQEMTRTSSGAMVGAAFGVAGAIAASAAVGADAAASKVVGESAFDVAVLNGVGTKVAGLIFFNYVKGSVAPKVLSVELTDSSGGAEQLNVPLPAVGKAPPARPGSGGRESARE